MHPEFFRTVAVFAHHGAVTSTHLGPVHAWLHSTLGLSKGAGTAVICVVVALLVFAAATAGVKKVFS